jgi:CAAX prenyl protease-like protein
MTARPSVSPSVPYVLPFVVFLVLLSIEGKLPVSRDLEFPIRVFVLAVVLWIASRNVIDLRFQRWAGAIALGTAVFLIWILPDLIWPGYRQYWLFTNPLTGTGEPVNYAGLSSVTLAFRAIRAVILVPIIEELFWRAWLMRWLIRPKFQEIPLGAWSAQAFWLTALMFASEHGHYWDVGLLAGIAYNWWMLRSKSIADCILAHAVTNGLLSAYVLFTGRWEYW